MFVFFTVVRWLGLFPCRKKVLGLNPLECRGSVGGVCMFPLPVWVLSGYSGLLLQLKHIHVGWFGFSKLNLVKACGGLQVFTHFADFPYKLLSVQIIPGLMLEGCRVQFAQNVDSSVRREAPRTNMAFIFFLYLWVAPHARSSDFF